MVGRDDLLCDDRPFVQLIGHKMGRSAYQFYSALIGLAIRVGSCKCRKEGVMNIDDLVSKSTHELRRKHPHEFGQHDIILFVAIDYVDNLLLGVGCVFVRNMVEWDVEPLANIL